MSKPPTINDVAKALGIHKSTVSLALSGKGTISQDTRDRVHAVVRDMGYEPSALAQRLANAALNPLVCLFSGTLDLGVATEKIQRIQSELNARGLEAPLYSSPGGAQRASHSQAAQLRQLCRQRPRAIVFAAQSVGAEPLAQLRAYQKAGGIVVSYDWPVELECDRVVFDREHNAWQAARCLLDAGHREVGIGMAAPPDWLAGAPTIPETHRLRGFRRALEEFGVPFRPEWLFEDPPYERGGEAMARRFLQMRDRPTGLCIVNDYKAFAFMVDLLRDGVRIPEDVSIVGHDNQDIASRCPVPLTCATQPVEEITRAVVEMLLERLDGYDGPPRTVTVRGELVQRASVARIANR